VLSWPFLSSKCSELRSNDTIALSRAVIGALWSIVLTRYRIYFVWSTLHWFECSPTHKWSSFLGDRFDLLRYWRRCESDPLKVRTLSLFSFLLSFFSSFVVGGGNLDSVPRFLDIRAKSLPHFLILYSSFYLSVSLSPWWFERHQYDFRPNEQWQKMLGLWRRQHTKNQQSLSNSQWALVHCWQPLVANTKTSRTFCRIQITILSKDVSQFVDDLAWNGVLSLMLLFWDLCLRVFLHISTEWSRDICDRVAPERQRKQCNTLMSICSRYFYALRLFGPQWRGCLASYE